MRIYLDDLVHADLALAGGLALLRLGDHQVQARLCQAERRPAARALQNRGGQAVVRPHRVCDRLCHMRTCVICSVSAYVISVRITSLQQRQHGVKAVGDDRQIQRLVADDVAHRVIDVRAPAYQDAHHVRLACSARHKKWCSEFRVANHVRIHIGLCVREQMADCKPPTRLLLSYHFNIIEAIPLSPLSTSPLEHAVISSSRSRLFTNRFFSLVVAAVVLDLRSW